MDLEVSTPISAEAEVKAYTLVGDDIYVKRYTNENIPTWYRQLISDIIASDNTITDLDAAVDYLSTLPAGYEHKITELQLADTTINTSLESLVTTTGSHTAAIANLNTTKVDATSAAAIARNTVGAYFADGTAGAWFNNQISTYASDIAANAMDISTLSATVDGHTVSIDTIEEITIYQGNSISQLTSDTAVAIANLQSQIDGSISTYFYDYAPTLLNLPASEWLTNDVKMAHVGDLFYDRTTGYGYRFAYEDIVDNPDMGIVFSWIRITDVDITTALANAATAQATADGKRTVFYTATAPVDQVINGTLIPIEEGDLWVNAATKVTKVYAKTSTNPDVFQWVDITNTATQNALIGLGVLEETNDGVVNTYYSNTEPTITTHPTISYGDWWVDTDATPTIKAYRYQDSNGKNVGTLSWVDESTSILGKSMVESDTAKKNIAKVVDGTLAINITNATVNGTTIGAYISNAVDTGTDNMVHVYSGSESQKPLSATLGDLYVETHSTTNVVTSYRWDGSSWVEIEGASNVKALADLTDGKRTIYTTSGIPSNTDAAGDLNIAINDLWIPPATVTVNTVTYRKGEIYICSSINPITFVVATEYYSLISNVQTQVDSKVDTYYQGTVPYANQTNVPKDIRAGDYWYCTTTSGSYIKGNIYKYVETSNGSNYNYTWTLNADVTKSAFDQIDGKRTIFGGATVPTAIAVNDVWIPNGYVGTSYKNGFMYQWNGTIWADNIEYTDDTTANAKTAVYYSASAPTVLTHVYLQEGDQWVPPANTGVYKANSIYTYINGAWVASTTESAEYAKNQLGATMYNSPSDTTPTAIAPAVLVTGDLWVVTDRWYTDATTSTSGTTRTTYGHLVRKYNGSTWVDITNTEAKASSLKWSAKSSKFITAPDGSITGFEMSDGSGQNSAFTITADTFKVVASGQSVASKNPFTVDASTGDITLNGKVSFNSVTDVPQLGSTPQEVVDAVNAGNTTTIDGGKITTGTVNADRIDASTVAASNMLVDQTVRSSDFTAIGGAGFRLKSNAAGTSADPTIYGAYIKGGVVDADSLVSGSLTETYFETRSELRRDDSYIHTLVDINNSNATGTATLVFVKCWVSNGEGSSITAKVGILASDWSYAPSTANTARDDLLGWFNDEVNPYLEYQNATIGDGYVRNTLTVLLPPADKNIRLKVMIPNTSGYGVVGYSLAILNFKK